MLYRKIESYITQRLSEDSNKILVVSGARQVGKSYIVRYVGTKLYKNFIEINLIEDYEGDRNFENVKSPDDLYIMLGSLFGQQLGNSTDTLIFFDEIQQYPHLITMLKFLRQDNRYRYVASGSLLGVTLSQTTSIPIGSIETLNMYPLDFEEFLIANNVGNEVISYLKQCFNNYESPITQIHERIITLFKQYLLVGGLPDAVNEFMTSRNIALVRKIQSDVHDLYEKDASKYDIAHRLNIRKIYNLIPSNMENKKKRVIFKDIEQESNRRSRDYEGDMEYLVSSGITIPVNAISNPKFPLIESEKKNLIKLYLNDVGILTGLLYRNNIRAILEDENSINLGSVYECVVAQQLTANNNRLFYYDNKKQGEVDFIIDDFASLSVTPIEVKSGKDYKRHVALSRLISVTDYNIKKGYVVSNSGTIERKGGIIYIPIYMTMFFDSTGGENQTLILPLV